MYSTDMIGFCELHLIMKVVRAYQQNIIPMLMNRGWELNG
jgi:hypothetical protein